MYENRFRFRRGGVSAETECTGRSLKAQFRYADKLRAKFVIVMGESEIAADEVDVKNFRTARWSALKKKIL